MHASNGRSVLLVFLRPDGVLQTFLHCGVQSRAREEKGGSGAAGSQENARRDPRADLQTRHESGQAVIEQGIPEALHLCPGCGDLASGETYCDACRAVAKFYDALCPGAASSCWSAPRLHPGEGVAAATERRSMESENGGSMLCALAVGLLFEACCVLLGFLVYRVWRVL